MTLEATIRCRLGPFELDVELSAKAGEVVAILGPNGSGKSTLLRCLAGLWPIDDGLITLDDVNVDDPAMGRFVPPEHRRVGVVFQDYQLFSTMSALENVAFGPRARGVPRREARAAAAHWLARMDLAEHARHRPRALSGGQQQRVALARALAIEPRLLLLDEPLSALDAGTRGGVRRDLRRHLDTFDGIRLLVTHDPVDAYALADRVVVIEAGRVVQTGTLADVTAHPRSRYVADLVGVNLVRGLAAGTTFHTTSGFDLLVAVGDDLDNGGSAGFAVIRPQAVALYRAAPDGSPRNVWTATVADLDVRADRVRVNLSGPLPIIAEVTPAALAALDLRPGDDVWVSVKATEITTYPA